MTLTFNRNPLEDRLVQKAKKYIKETYREEAWVLKVAGSASQRSGVPDMIICLKGKFIALEFKREDGSGKASENQLIEISKIKNSGGVSCIVSNLEDIKNILDWVYNQR